MHGDSLKSRTLATEDFSTSYLFMKGLILLAVAIDSDPVSGDVKAFRTQGHNTPLVYAEMAISAEWNAFAEVKSTVITQEALSSPMEYLRTTCLLQAVGETEGAVLRLLSGLGVGRDGR